MQENRFGEEVGEYLNLKGKSTRETYSSAFQLFLEFYRQKYGMDKGFGDYLDRIFAEFQKPPRKQKRIAEIDMVEYIE